MHSNNKVDVGAPHSVDDTSQSTAECHSGDEDCALAVEEEDHDSVEPTANDDAAHHSAAEHNAANHSTAKDDAVCHSAAENDAPHHCAAEHNAADNRDQR